METLVFPNSMCLREGLYVELFLIGALNKLYRQERKRAFLAKTSTFKTTVACFLLKNEVL